MKDLLNFFDKPKDPLSFDAVRISIASPEMIQGLGHNFCADHWSLGILVYEMLSGENPFYIDGMDEPTLQFPSTQLLATQVTEIISRSLSQTATTTDPRAIPALANEVGYDRSEDREHEDTHHEEHHTIGTC